MTFPRSFDRLLESVIDANRSWEAGWPPVAPDPAQRLDPEIWAAATRDLSERLRENYPHFHPLYAGQMLKPPHPAAVIGYLAAMLVNPNNHALDGGRATAALEKEAVASLAHMFGLRRSDFMGHLTASGTVARLTTPTGACAASCGCRASRSQRHPTDDSISLGSTSSSRSGRSGRSW
jgi:hypothetical protein